MKKKIFNTQHVFHTLPESKKRQPMRCSGEIYSLNLAVERKRLECTMRVISMPTGIASDAEKEIIYKEFIFRIMHADKSSISGSSIINDVKVNLPRVGASLEFISEKKNLGEIDVEFAFRLWVKHKSELISRVLLFIIVNKEKYFDGVFEETFASSGKYHFGNVDLFVLPKPLSNNVGALDIGYIEKHHDVSNLSPFLFKSVMRYLDHGQCLNLSYLRNQGISDLGRSERSISLDPFQQYLDDFYYYMANSPNGELMNSTLPDSLCFIHQTKHMEEIIQKREIQVSKAGCIGSVVYVTTVIDNRDSHIIGGHTAGLYRRRFPEGDINGSSFLFFKVDQICNPLTNWIEKLGRGRILLEARNKIIFLSKTSSQKKLLNEINKVSEDAIAQYNKLFPLLIFLKLYSTSLKRISAQDMNICEKSFFIVNRIMRDISIDGDGNYYSEINNIVFEIIKDYIFLYQTDSESRRWASVGSFNLRSQDEIFFTICPQLAHKWNTRIFPTDLERIILTLQGFELIQNREEELILFSFFMDRISSYINVNMLEGANTLVLPEEVRGFDDLANTLPNLAGVLFNNTLKNKHGKETLIQDIYEGHLRDCYRYSYDDRKINVAIKSGICGTEEAGIRTINEEKTMINVYRTSTSENANGFFAVKHGEELPIEIRGVSNRNGFSMRT